MTSLATSTRNKPSNADTCGLNGRERTLLLLAIWSKVNELAGPPVPKLTVRQILGKEPIA